MCSLQIIFTELWTNEKRQGLTFNHMQSQANHGFRCLPAAWSCRKPFLDPRHGQEAGAPHLQQLDMGSGRALGTSPHVSVILEIQSRGTGMG